MVTNETETEPGRVKEGKQRQDAEPVQTSHPFLRRSIRLQEKQQKQKKLIEPAASSPGKVNDICPPHQEQRRTGRGTTRPKGKGEGHGSSREVGPSSAEQRVRKTADHRRQVGKDNGIPKHSSQAPTRQEESVEFGTSAVQARGDAIALWVDTSLAPQQKPTDLEKLPPSPPEMSTSLTERVHSVQFGESTSVLAASQPEDSPSSKHQTTVHNAVFRQRNLAYRHIYVNRETPPQMLMERAKQITEAPQSAPSLKKAAIQQVKEAVRMLEDQPEEKVRTQMASWLNLEETQLPSPALVQVFQQRWNDAVLIPLGPKFSKHSLPLPQPTPDMAFGYAEAAFTEERLSSTTSLIAGSPKGKACKRYAVPHRELHFPFLVVEFKSQANRGTHFFATNQAAGAGAIGLNGCTEVFRRGLGVDKLDLNEPWFFSLTVDHELARLNVHWVQLGKEQPDHFHMKVLSKYLLDDAKHLKKLRRAIQNIFDYSREVRLPTLCAAIDACTGIGKQMEVITAAAKAEGAVNDNHKVDEESGVRSSPLRNELVPASSSSNEKRGAETSEGELRRASGQTPAVSKSRRTNL